MTDEKRYAELRAKLMPGYTGKDVHSLESDIDDRVMNLVGLVEREYIDKDQFMDFAKLAQYFTLDNLTQIAFGHPFGFLTKNEDLFSYNASSTAYFPIMELGCKIPFIHKILTSPLMQATAAPKPDEKIGFGAIVDLTQKVVAERFGPEPKHRQDMLGSFVAHGVTQQVCESESMLQILAGAESTATTLRCTFLYILTNPTVYAKLLAERSHGERWEDRFSGDQILGSS
jgi:cytochrome P450